MDKLQGLFLEHNRLVGTIPKAIYRGSGLGANPLPLVQLFLQQVSVRVTCDASGDFLRKQHKSIYCS